MTPGNALAHRFCDAVNAGLSPEREDLERVAQALEVLRWGNAGTNELAEFAKRLGSAKKQGQEASQQRQWLQHARSVLDVLVHARELEARGHSKPEAEKLARREIARRIHIEDPSMRARMRKYRKTAELMLEVLGL
jgi:hypothetical protein